LRHLTTKELLRHFDGQLTLNKSQHMKECAFCQSAAVDLQAVLYEVERDLRHSIPAETETSQAASLERLRESMLLQTPVVPGVTESPWLRPVYGVAAAVLVAALGGYLAFGLLAPPLRENGDGRALARLSSIPAEELVVPVATADLVNSELTSEIPESTVVFPKEPKTVELFEVNFEPSLMVAQQPAFFSEGPTLEGIPSDTWNKATRFSNLDLPIVRPLKVTGSDTFDSTELVPRHSEAVETVVEGYWLLAKAGVWEEDLRPVDRSGQLYFVGTVENNVTRARVLEALSGRAGQAHIGFDLSSRDLNKATSNNTEGLVKKTIRPTSRPSGGVMRTALLSHFQDAARRSFQSPEFSLLEAELDSYVKRIFRGQTRLLAHAYALNSLLSDIKLGYVDNLSFGAKRRLREVIRFHLAALRDEEEALHDRLSEVLPRKYWAYKSGEFLSQRHDDWSAEGEALLNDALRLDSVLGSLFGAVPETIQISDVNHSCSDLLRSIRVHLDHLKAPLKTLQ